MNSVNINGKSYIVQGDNVTIDNDKVIVNGNVIEDNLKGIVKIEWIGDLAKLDCTSAVINGNVYGNVVCTNLKCKNIKGDVDCTSLNCNDIVGDVDGTSINCRSKKKK